jgi:hypothetical protein
MTKAICLEVNLLVDWQAQLFPYLIISKKSKLHELQTLKDDEQDRQKIEAGHKFPLLDNLLEAKTQKVYSQNDIHQ